ncbi:type VI secretion system tip protein VgrG [Azoarcus indigens]|uniref:Type VI secretion system secreted protein VgrG n=1 Tax=Azoarcus indigens TaxID=29545 RepID=A0A4R6DYU5_9RHOO|nr:type VI secretion system tip protein VgrG [Azoarcus indigens]NMG65124.1 type VI secretion system tip protein VgrG [Azoarcus indigens]TDN49618.1 type VI secretion system secreted protein VgrG [Azoarcus indigens]
MPSQSNLRFTFTVGETEFDVIEFTLDEGLSEGCQLALELASHDPAIDFAKVLDAPAHFILWHGEHPVRHVHGKVSRFEQGTTGFRRTRYRALVEPPLARLELCADWRIFQQKTVPEILDQLLAEHGIAPYQQNLTEQHLTREYCVQAGDTDLDFLLRLAAEEGLFHRFDHRPDGCTLIHSDRLHIQGAIAGGPVRYNPTPGGDRPEPALRTFTYAEHVRTTRQTQRDYTFKHPQYDQQRSAMAERPIAAERDYEDYRYPGRYKDLSGEAFTRDRLRGLRGQAQIATVEGDDPRLVPGLAFDLIGHPRQDWNHGWRPVHIRHEGRQHTSQAEEGAGAQSGTRYQYTAQLVPDRVEWRPMPRPRPLVPGPQVATVVGPEGEEFHVDEFGRVRVQFPWDREGAHNEHSSCWIRPLHGWAGSGWGQITLPRIGQEVIVAFLDGDPDQPVITGRSYRVGNRPPYELPKHQVLSTLKSKEHKGQRASELRLDDTTREISAALMNDHGQSHLHLGYLTHPRPDGGQPRGEGFELRTDLHGALRAAQGMLLSTEAQASANGGLLDRAQLVSTLEAALELARTLGDYAGEHQGLPHHAQPQEVLTEAVRNLGHGANDQADGGGKGNEAVIALSAPAGIALASPRSIALGAGEHIDAAAHEHVQLTAGEQMLLNAGQGLGTFAQSGDMRHIAHQGQLLLQAQHNNARLEADQSVEISASQQHVLFAAKQHITLLCGGAYVKIADGNIEMGMPGDFVVKAGKHSLVGPGSASFPLPRWSKSDAGNWIEINHRGADGQPFAGQEYRILFENGQNITGKLDAQGYARHENVPEKAVKVEYAPLEPREDSVWEPLRHLIDAARNKLG